MGVSIVFDKILQCLGAIASIISFAYALFIAKDNRNAKFENNKTNIIEKLLFIIGYENEFDSIQILSIIRSVSRKNKINENEVLPSEIIEDLINIVTGNPIISEQKKIEINQKLKKVLGEYLLYQGFTKMSDEDKKIFLCNISDEAKKYFATSNIDMDKYKKEKQIRFVINFILNFLIITVTLFLIAFLFMHIFSNQDYYFLNLFFVSLPLIFMVTIIYYKLIKKKK